MKKDKTPERIISETEAQQAIDILNAPADREDIESSNKTKLDAGELIARWIDQAPSNNEKRRREDAMNNAIGVFDAHPSTQRFEIIIPGSVGLTNQETPASATSSGTIHGGKTPRDLDSKSRLARS